MNARHLSFVPPPHYYGDIDKVNGVQRSTTMISGLEGLIYKERLKELNMQHSINTKEADDLVAVLCEV